MTFLALATTAVAAYAAADVKVLGPESTKDVCGVLLDRFKYSTQDELAEKFAENLSFGQAALSGLPRTPTTEKLVDWKYFNRMYNLYSQTWSKIARSEHEQAKATGAREYCKATLESNLGFVPHAHQPYVLDTMLQKCIVFADPEIVEAFSRVYDLSATDLDESPILKAWTNLLVNCGMRSVFDFFEGYDFAQDEGFDGVATDELAEVVRRTFYFANPGNWSAGKATEVYNDCRKGGFLESLHTGQYLPPHLHIETRR